MKHPRAKRIVSIVVLALLVLLMLLVHLGINGMQDELNYGLETENRMASIGDTVIRLFDTYCDAAQAYVSQLYTNLALTVPSLRDAVRLEGDDAIRSFENGCVLRRGEDGELVLPEDIEGLPVLEPIQRDNASLVPDPCRPFEDRMGAFWALRPAGDDADRADEANRADNAEDADAAGEEYLLCIYCRIYGAYYCLEYASEADIVEFQMSHADVVSAFESLEDSYGCHILCLGTDEAMSEYYIPDELREIGVTGAELGLSPDAGMEFTPLEIGGKSYVYAMSDVMEDSYGDAFRIALLLRFEDFYGRSLEKDTILVTLSMVILVVLAVWVLSVTGLMRRETVRASQRRRYSPTRVRLVTAAIGIAGAVVILLSSMFTDALTDLYDRTRSGQNALRSLESLVESNRGHEADVASQREALYLGYAGRIASLLAEYPDLQTTETLEEMCEAIGADYLMLYDDRGNERMSNARYVGLTYGTDETSSTGDFRRLIRGVPSIVHAACVDEVTGLNRQLIGVCMDDGDVSDGYGSLIVALEPDAAEGMISTDDILRSIMAPDSLVFAVERETGSLRMCSDAALAGRSAYDLGLSEASVRDGFMDFFTLNGERWYGCSAEFDGAVYYYAVPANTLFDGNVRQGLFHVLGFLLGYMILAITVLSGYTEANLDRYGGQVVDDESWIAQQSEAKRDRTLGRRTRRLRSWWDRKTPERKAWFTLQALLCLSLLWLAELVHSWQQTIGEMTIISYVLNGRWERGVNVFAMTSIVILALVIALALLAAKLVFGLLSGVLETRGETICRLLGNMVQYAGVIIGLFMAFDALGFDTRTLLASLGIFSLAVSLGAKDLVADVLAGVSIVFSGEYQIGEIIEVAGFRGRVWEIGVRSTTLLNDEGNIKIISNRNISNVMNLSRMNTRVSLQFTVGCDRPVSELEALVARELPDVSRRAGAVIGAVEYRGVVSVGGGSVTLAFAAECREQDVRDVRGRLNVELMRMFERCGVPLSQGR